MHPISKPVLIPSTRLATIHSRPNKLNLLADILGIKLKFISESEKAWNYTLFSNIQNSYIRY